jgi:hypothetical protein
MCSVVCVKAYHGLDVIQWSHLDAKSFFQKVQKLHWAGYYNQP